MTRVPPTVGTAKALCEAPPEGFDGCELGEGYRRAVMGAHYGGLRQRGCLVESDPAQARERTTFERRRVRQEEALDKALRALQRRVFGCVAAAEQALEALRTPYRYPLIEAPVEPHRQHARRGRPKTGEAPEGVGYRLSLHWQRHAPASHALGRFILATHLLDEQELSDAEVLIEYKKQSEVERGFRFLKDPWFMADAVFLKTPRRIEALMRVMTLCLRVYNVGQHWLRQRLTAQGQTLPSQVGKPTAKPTLRWVFQLMEGGPWGAAVPRAGAGYASGVHQPPGCREAKHHPSVRLACSGHLWTDVARIAFHPFHASMLSDYSKPIVSEVRNVRLNRGLIRFLP